MDASAYIKGPLSTITKSFKHCESDFWMEMCGFLMNSNHGYFLTTCFEAVMLVCFYYL